MNGLKLYIKENINKIIHEEGESAGGAIVGTLSNTLGMGNPMTPTDTQPGTEPVITKPIITAKTHKEKRRRSKTKKLRESILDDEDVLVNDNTAIAIETTINLSRSGIIVTHGYNKQFKFNDVHYNQQSGIIYFDKNPHFFLKEMNFNDIIEQYKKNGVNINGFSSDSAIWIENNKDDKPITIEGITLLANAHVNIRGSIELKDVGLGCRSVNLSGSGAVYESPKILVDNVKNIYNKWSTLNVFLRDYRNSSFKLSDLDGFGNICIIVEYSSKFRNAISKCIDPSRSRVTKIDYTLSSADDLFFDNKKLIDLLGIKKISNCTVDINFVGHSKSIDIIMEKTGSNISVLSIDV